MSIAGRLIEITKLSDDVFDGEHPNGIQAGYVKRGVVYEDPEPGSSFILVNGFYTSNVKSWDPETGILKTKNSTYKIEVLQ